jgi:drug/metabolite transporter (DMT)-like permease
VSLWHWFPLFILSSLSEIGTQFSLKKSANDHQSSEGFDYYRQLIMSRWVWTGMIVYIVDVIVWIIILAHVPLSQAFPLTGMQKIFIIFFSAWALRERIRLGGWVGIFLICAGIIMIASDGQMVVKS